MLGSFPPQQSYQPPGMPRIGRVGAGMGVPSPTQGLSPSQPPPVPAPPTMLAPLPPIVGNGAPPGTGDGGMPGGPRMGAPGTFHGPRQAMGFGGFRGLLSGGRSA